MTVHIGNHCLLHAHENPERLVMAAHRVLEYVSYDTLVASGMSGALVLPILALGLHKNKLLVRKPGDKHRYHDNVMAEGDLGSRWVFVDDGMVTGGTLEHVQYEVEALASKYGQSTQFAGAYLYGHVGDPPHFIAAGDHRLQRRQLYPHGAMVL